MDQHTIFEAGSLNQRSYLDLPMGPSTTLSSINHKSSLEKQHVVIRTFTYIENLVSYSAYKLREKPSRTIKCHGLQCNRSLSNSHNSQVLGWAKFSVRIPSKTLFDLIAINVIVAVIGFLQLEVINVIAAIKVKVIFRGKK